MLPLHLIPIPMVLVPITSMGIIYYLAWTFVLRHSPLETATDVLQMTTITRTEGNPPEVTPPDGDYEQAELQAWTSIPPPPGLV
jgi:hypothetical protein